MTVHDLSAFREANAKSTQKGAKKLGWDERVELIKHQFPSVISLDWKKAFDRDLDLFAWIMKDVLKVDAAEPGRSGPKPAVEYRAGVTRFRQMMGEDYSMRPFHEAFTILAGERSLSALAAKTGVSRSRIRLLLRGDIQPSWEQMEKIAAGFAKSPGYFLEYRRGVVVAAIWERLTAIPEASVKYFYEIASAA